MLAIAYVRYGGPDVTEVMEAPVPSPAADQVLIRVRAAGLNPVDAYQRAGALRAIAPQRLPLVGGNELSGVVEAVGERVESYRPGDAVIARTGKVKLGAFAQYAVVREDIVARAPHRVDLTVAAGLPLAGLTALQALDALELRAGERILITGGAGGVGLFAIRLATLRGAHVTTTASSAGEEFVRAAGAAAVIDYHTTSPSAVGETFDKVFDLVGGEELPRLFGVTRKGGLVLSIAGPVTADAIAGDLHGLRRVLVSAVLNVRTRGIRAAARRAGVSYRYLFMHPDGPQLQSLADLVDDGRLDIVIDSTYDFADFRAAFERLESRRAKGKVLLTMP